MIINNNNKNFETNIDKSETSQFQIEGNAQAFQILSKNLYSDIPRAIIRELCCNAIDANLDADNPNPIQIKFPTNDEPILEIIDQGIGMTEEDVYTVYKTFFKSTKNSDNKRIGAYGLGGKTPFAYTDQFILTTTAEDIENKFLIFKDENQIPQITKISSKQSFNNGTIVSMNVNKEDIYYFEKAALKTFLFFNKIPEILRGEKSFYQTLQTIVDSKDTSPTEAWKENYKLANERVKSDVFIDKLIGIEDLIIKELVGSYNCELGVIMGQVFYEVNVKNIKKDDINENILFFPLYNNEFKCVKVIHCNIGDIDTQPSRESLNYTNRTISFLQNKFYKHFNNNIENLVKDFSIKTITSVDSKEMNCLKRYFDMGYIKDKFLIDWWNNRTSLLNCLYQETDAIENGYILFGRFPNNYYGKKIELERIIHNVEIERSAILMKMFFDELFIKKSVSNVFIADGKNIEKINNTFKDRHWTLHSNITKRILTLDIKTNSTIVILDEKTALKFVSVFECNPIKIKDLPKIKIERKKRKPKEKHDDFMEVYLWTDWINYARENCTGRNYKIDEILDLILKGDTCSWEIMKHNNPSYIINNKKIYENKSRNVYKFDVACGMGDFVPSVGNYLYKKLKQYKNIGLKMGVSHHHHFIINKSVYDDNKLWEMTSFPQIDVFMLYQLKNQLPNIENFINSYNEYVVKPILPDKTKLYVDYLEKNYNNCEHSVFYRIMKSKNTLSLVKLNNLIDILKKEFVLYFKMTIENCENEEQMIVYKYIWERIQYFKDIASVKEDKCLDYKDEVIQYPMLKYVNLEYRNLPSEIGEICDYVASIDGLRRKPKKES